MKWTYHSQSIKPNYYNYIYFISETETFNIIINIYQLNQHYQLQQITAFTTEIEHTLTPRT